MTDELTDELVHGTDGTVDDELLTADVEDEAHAEAIRKMYELHRDVGRAAMTKALAVINQIDVADIPINVAVQLLKFGAELERRAVLGIEPDGEDDPFGALAGALDGG